jgi:hypothetical protein
VPLSWWEAKGRLTAYKILGITLALLTLLILFCEITIVSNVNISPLGQLIEAVGNSATAVQIFSVIPMIYLSYCAYYPLFKLRFGKLYYLSHHRTDENSLLNNVTFLLRISAPLAYNYVLLLRIPRTSLEILIGKISVIPFFGSNFNSIFPIFIAVFAALFYFDALSLLFKCLNIQKFRFLSKSKLGSGSTSGNQRRVVARDNADRGYNDYDEDVSDQIAEGKNLVNAWSRKNRHSEAIRLNEDPESQTEIHNNSGGRINPNAIREKYNTKLFSGGSSSSSRISNNSLPEERRNIIDDY